MKQRIYWLLPDLASARRTMADLLGAGIETRHIHFAGREGLDLDGLHAANVLQTSDVVHAAQRGLVFGGSTGICAGFLVALYFPVFGAELQWEVAAVLAVLGGVIGAWSSSMIGISIPSPRLERFESAIAQGRILLMIDVLPSQTHAMAALLQDAHPEAHFEGAERHARALIPNSQT
jgi:hypothetical protein